MRPARHDLLLTLLACGVACAAPRLTARPAHGTYDPAQGSRVTAGAISALTERGFELAFHDAKRGLILTRQREGQARWGGSEWLARDTFVIRLEEGRASAVLSRQLFDAALRAWEAPRDAAELDAVEAEEVGLLSAFLSQPPSLRPSRAGEPCASDESCESGLTCDSRRCRAPRASTPPARVPAPSTKRQR